MLSSRSDLVSLSQGCLNNNPNLNITDQKHRVEARFLLPFLQLLLSWLQYLCILAGRPVKGFQHQSIDVRVHGDQLKEVRKSNLCKFLIQIVPLKIYKERVYQAEKRLFSLQLVTIFSIKPTLKQPKNKSGKQQQQVTTL